MIDADLHVHGAYSGGTSKNMSIPLLAKYAELKGLGVLGTGDCLHAKWLAHLEECLAEDKGAYITSGSSTKFLIQTEVQDIDGVHHLILLPHLDSAKELREEIKKYSSDIDLDGRPRVRLDAQKIVEFVLQVGGIIGPAHAFTPYYAIYSKFDSLEECYGPYVDKIHFLELGLSADSYLADSIEELYSITFLSNSDAHSYLPHRLGREFNRFDLEDISFDKITEAIKNNKIVLNAGFDPKEGKYHLTACNKCYRQYELEEARKRHMRCPCGGYIKKGVRDRIMELGGQSKPGERSKPVHRPEYKHLIPLTEIICKALGISSIYSKKVQDVWKNLVGTHGNEIAVLLDAPVQEIEPPEIARAIKAFREEKIEIIPGGGGKYGEIRLPGERQKSLDEFTKSPGARHQT